VKIRILENLHLPLWLIKDTCWAMVWRPLGVAMILPTVLLALWITWKTRKHPEEFLPALSVSCWITANSIWMCDEFFELDVLYLSISFFALGFLVIGIWIIRYLPEMLRSKAE
jgi:hypothetical protein